MTKEVNLLGALHPATRAADLGLWNRVVDDQRLESEVQALVEVLLSKNQQAARQLKFIINRGVEADQYNSAGLRGSLRGAERRGQRSLEGSRRRSRTGCPRFCPEGPALEGTALSCQGFLGRWAARRSRRPHRPMNHTVAGPVDSGQAAAEISPLPHVDEHSTSIAACARQTWKALPPVAEVSFSFTAAVRIARILGCTDAATFGPHPLQVGSGFPGFHVAASAEKAVLAFAGQHRFSSYALAFRLERYGEEGTCLSAETRADFTAV